ncbi:alpha/beta hydrolase [Aspergillus puulaauensis]|uniref:Peptidase S9 prolyl oligopeptidase catalytic domain-containing protein n=1 Tax=Aspergillus puulaauensis TaxID=1220207 RepID=A0A7R7XBP5_9EURO|nr:uncharacterized protein APUU_11096A [Aspergillus puulaauensis]BCS18268.1 hypothetical protein APUU_11096A [Aspergillus puulaauensis]
MRVFAVICSLLSMVAARPHSPNDRKLSYHPAPENNGLGIAVLVIPGGGYEHVSPQEASNSTTYLNARGYDAWVLNYTVADIAPTPLYPVPLEEALSAARYIRTQDKVKVDKLGIWGYSAGGHLAAVTVTNPDAGLDFGILAYPVISMDLAITHNGSRTNLLGENPPRKLVEKMSAENRVTETTPPIFVYHSADDATVPVENTLRFVGALTAKQRPFQVLVIPDGEHGIGLAMDDPQRNWAPELDRFMAYSI